MNELPDSAALASLEPDDLDGHSIDELADYLDAGMQPPVPSIDDSPACQNALAAIIRLRHASLGSLENAARSEAPADESWIGGVLANISIEARSGRDVPLRSTSATERPVMTEGAIRSLVRRAGDSVPGIVVARCAIEGDVTQLLAPVRVSVEVAIVAGPSIPATADLVRNAVDLTLREQTDLVVEAIDVVVRDLLVGRDADEAHADPAAVDVDTTDPDRDTETDTTEEARG
ncbi:Asp23/Gls24 family envelope stress response protein [Curtobacterium sp. MCLR17_007]|uniref:Asp23/Gls24 family envelope stress response protein n=1 Tax=Curtobacterium sp. MCLR17_007 TaxID=2175648 RepID=UPI000DA983C9|nr:Asp23/Gls24 family envelope stress response protein [Curtobacterium sp. MCLR17_007]WIB59341.1 Asp23/Gls24 family envelope stress response protein [Curtobacterium sp. MCLR17_007]